MQNPQNYIVRINIKGIFFDSKPMTENDAASECLDIKSYYPNIHIYTVEIY